MALEAYLMAFIGMPSGPVAFLGFKDFIIKLISAAVGFGKSKRVNNNLKNARCYAWFLNFYQTERVWIVFRGMSYPYLLK